jgi:secretion/DNA translocation related TadE-like protein
VTGSAVRHQHDQGIATVLSAVVSLGLITIWWLGMQVGVALVARHRAEEAADLAALAAAAFAPQGESIACGRADWVARRMRTAIVFCRLAYWDARVEVRAQTSGVIGDLVAVGRSRAGPVERST